MKTRNDGSRGRTAAEIIAEDATRENKSHEAYNSSMNYEGDAGDLDAEEVENIDDDFLQNDDLEKNDQNEA